MATGRSGRVKHGWYNHNHNHCGSSQSQRRLERIKVHLGQRPFTPTIHGRVSDLLLLAHTTPHLANSNWQ